MFLQLPSSRNTSSRCTWRTARQDAQSVRRYNPSDCLLFVRHCCFIGQSWDSHLILGHTSALQQCICTVSLGYRGIVCFLSQGCGSSAGFCVVCGLHKPGKCWRTTKVYKWTPFLCGYSVPARFEESWDQSITRDPGFFYGFLLLLYDVKQSWFLVGPCWSVVYLLLTFYVSGMHAAFRMHQVWIVKRKIFWWTKAGSFVHRANVQIWAPGFAGFNIAWISLLLCTGSGSAMNNDQRSLLHTIFKKSILKAVRLSFDFLFPDSCRLDILYFNVLYFTCCVLDAFA